MNRVDVPRRTGQCPKATIAQDKWRPAPAHAPLSYTRPRGRVKSSGSVHNHSFVFNRPARLSDLGDISPSRLDTYDRQNYKKIADRTSGLSFWVSKRNDRFVLADPSKVKKQTVIAMLALGKCLVIRKNGVSNYLMGDHTWALWGWVEAADRKELDPQRNTLVHADDHNDFADQTKIGIEKTKLTIDNVDQLITTHVLSGSDKTGIGSFIVPAHRTKFLSLILWIYSKNTSEEAQEVQKNKLYELQREQEKPANLNDPWGVRNSSGYWTFQKEKILPTSAKPTYTFMLIPDGSVRGLRSDIFSKQYLRDLPGKRIVDTDIDFDDSPAELDRVFRQLTGQGEHCRTIAISPHYGPDNHLEKIALILDRLREL